MAALGSGQREEIEADEALAIARESSSIAMPKVDPAAYPLGFSVGDEVSVAADDYGQDPVNGTLLILTRDAIAIRRQDDLAGEVVVHFPRSGFELRKA
jgi:hypothetical protein